MKRSSFLASLVVVATLSLTGCGSARLVRHGPEGGIVAIPSNSNFWPCNYRADAEKVMAAKCPAGYDIVREEEVVVGQTTRTDGSSDRKQDGERQTTSIVTTTSEKTEYRIHFRPRTPVGPVLPSPIQTTSHVQPAGPAGLPPRPVPVAP